MLNLHNTLAHPLHRLAAEIGPRPVGSPGNHAAAEYIHATLQAAGCTVERQPYACPAWCASGALLEWDGQTLAVEANAFSPACDVTAPILPVGTLPELEAAHLTGKIALFYGDLAQAPLSAKRWFLKSEREAQIIGLLEAKRPAALLTVRPPTFHQSQGTEDSELDLPAATLPTRPALQLLRAAPVTVRLRLDTTRTPGETANVVGRQPGARPEKVVLCAHYDTKINTPGAHDNAGGVAALLALARHFSAQRPNCSLEYVAFTGEEYLPLGDDTYWQTAQGSQMLAVINLDGAGACLGSNSLTAMHCSEAFCDLAQAARQAYPGAVWVAPWPESNHSSFVWHGVPALALSTVGVRGVAHSPEDTVDQVSVAKLNEAASLAADLVLGLQDQPLAWGREKPAALAAG